MLTYIKHPTKQIWTVKLNGRNVGEIRQEGGLFQYWPKGSRVGGEKFATCTACKQSLES